MPSETTTACVSLLVFFRIRRGTFPYGVEDDASTISQTPTTHYTSTCVKLTIVTHLSFSERIAIANLSYCLCMYVWSSRIARVWINRVRLPTLLVVSWTGKMNISLYAFASENLVSRDGFGCPVPRQPAHLHTQAESGAYLRDPSRVPRRRPLFILDHYTPSGQSRVYWITQLRTDVVHCRESAGTGPSKLNVFPNACCLGRSPWTN